MLTGSMASDINDNAALIWFTTGGTEEAEEAIKILSSISLEYNKDKDSDNKLLFFCDDFNNEDHIGDSLKKFTGIPEDVKVALVNIPQQNVSPQSLIHNQSSLVEKNSLPFFLKQVYTLPPGTEVNEAAIKEIVEKFGDLTLETRPLKSY